jgi:bacillithiol system protein YtxJ
MRVEDQWHFPEGEEVAIYCLDIISFRHISNYIADTFSVYHESPQLLLIQKGKCTYHASHFNIHLDDLKELI